MGDDMLWWAVKLWHELSVCFVDDRLFSCILFLYCTSRDYNIVIIKRDTKFCGQLMYYFLLMDILSF